MDIPVYLIAGFLDAGKTSFINGILQDGFAAEDRTLLLCCEEGETAYDPKVLGNVFTYTIDEPEQMTPELFKKLEKQYRPKQVIIEFNGMWQIEPLYREGLPANWILYQIMCLVDANTFEPYVRNMGQLMMEKISNADLLIFNRCNEQLRAQLRSRNLQLDSEIAELEKLPLEQLIDHSFGSIFPNMDAKWLRVYERTALYGETLEIADYSPEIDTDLRIICFPTFRGHCGCILFDQAEIQTVRTGSDK